MASRVWSRSIPLLYQPLALSFLGFEQLVLSSHVPCAQWPLSLVAPLESEGEIYSHRESSTGFLVLPSQGTMGEHSRALGETKWKPLAFYMFNSRFYPQHCKTNQPPTPDSQKTKQAQGGSWKIDVVPSGLMSDLEGYSHYIGISL